MFLVIRMVRLLGLLGLERSLSGRFGHSVPLCVHCKMRGEKQGKFEANTREALFLGYEFAPGYVHPDYRVATLPIEAQLMDTTPILFTFVERLILSSGGDVLYPAAAGQEGVKDCVTRYVPASEADDRTIHMLHEGIVDESGILTESQKERGWTVHRFGERLVRTPPHSTRPPDWTPEDWRNLPVAVRKALAELHNFIRRNRIGSQRQHLTESCVLTRRV
eukprot:5279493-Amphidinium_carterae.4